MSICVTTVSDQFLKMRSMTDRARRVSLNSFTTHRIRPLPELTLVVDVAVTELPALGGSAGDMSVSTGPSGFEADFP